jgi:type I restriction enzyme R subunit
VINERFGKDLNEADQLFFDQIVAAAVRDDELQQAAEASQTTRQSVAGSSS